MKSRGQILDGVRVDTSDLSWFRQRVTLLPAKGDEVYITRIEVPVVGVYKHSGRGEVPKSLELIEASANILRLSGKRLSVYLSIRLPFGRTTLSYLYTWEMYAVKPRVIVFQGEMSWCSVSRRDSVLRC